MGSTEGVEDSIQPEERLSCIDYHISCTLNTSKSWTRATTSAIPTTSAVCIPHCCNRRSRMKVSIPSVGTSANLRMGALLCEGRVIEWPERD